MSGFKSFVLSAVIATCLAAGNAYAVSEPVPSVSTHGAGEASVAEKALVARIEAGLKALNDNDIKGAAVIFRSLIDSPDFASAPADTQYYAYFFLAFAEYNLEQYLSAYDHALEAGKRAPEQRDSEYWFLVGDLAFRLDKSDVEAKALTQLAQNFPDELRGMGWQYLFEHLRKLDASGQRADYAQVLQALWDSAYVTDDSLQTMDAFWFDLFEIRVAEGNQVKAREVLAKIDDPNVVISLRSDKRYRDLITGDVAHSDFQAAYDRQTDRYRILAATYPRRSEVVVYLGMELMHANKLDEALEILDEVIDKVKKAPKDKPAYDDLDEQYNWVLDTRARVLSKQGKWSEVETILTKARDYALAKNEDVVSQKINLGDFYYEQGRPAAALNEVKDVSASRSSPYGVMAAEEVRACAYAQLGDKEKLKASLDYMRAHADDGFGPFNSALLCVGDIDSLARIIVVRLDDPKTRNATLVRLQTYLPDPNITPFVKLMNANRSKVLASPEVQAAMAKYGFREFYPVFSEGN